MDACSAPASRAARWWRWYLAAGLITAGVFFLLPSGGVGQRFILIVAPAAGLIALLGGVVLHHPERRPVWWALVVGMTCYIVANTVWYVSGPSPAGPLSIPPIVGILYATWYGLLFAGLAVLIGRSVGRGDLIDALIVTAGVAVVIWSFLIDPAAEAASPTASTGASAVVSAIFAVLLLGLATLLLFRSRGRTPASMLLSLFLAAALTADTWYAIAMLKGSYAIGDPSDAVWLASFALLGAAALHPSMRELGGPVPQAEKPRGRRRLLAVAVGALVPLVVLVLNRHRPGPVVPALTVVSVGTFLLAFARISDLMVSVDMHRRVQAHLEQAEAWYRALVEELPAFTYIDVPDQSSRSGSRSIYASPQIEAMFGYTPEEFCADPEVWTRMLHPEDRERQFAEDVHLWSTGEPYTSEFRLIAKDGRTVWARNDATLVRNASGEAGFSQGVMYDITQEKAAEELLRRSEVRFRSLLANAPDAAVVVDEAGVITLVNHRTEELFGYAANEMVGLPIETLLPERFRGAHVGHRAGYLAHPVAREMGSGLELFARRKDGSEFPVDVSLSSVPAGGPGGERLVVALARDVTERKRAEDELRRRDAILEAVAVTAERLLHSGSWEAAADDVLAGLGQATGASRAYLFRNDRGEDGRLLMTETHEWVAPGIATTIDDPEKATFPCAGGFERWARELGAKRPIHGVRSSFPEPERKDLESEGVLSTAAVPVFVDDEWWGYLGFDDCLVEREWSRAEIEALWAAAGILGGAIRRTRGEEELAELNAELEQRVIERTAEVREARAFLASVIETSPAVIYRGRAGDFLITYVSPNVERILGYRTEEVLRTPSWWLEHIHPDDRAMMWGAVEARMPQAETVLRVRARDGTYRWFYNVVRHEYDGAGNQVGFLGASLDITDRKLAEDALVLAKDEAERAKEEAERANRAKSEFLSRASHELRTPLNAILGFGQLLQTSRLLPEDRDSVKQVMKAGRHLLELVNELLDISRIHAGRLSLSIEPVLVDEVVHETLDLILPLALEGSVQLHTEDSQPSLYVVADRQRLKQVLLNLLSNAVKYNREGGGVTVSWERSGETVTLRVADTGPGIAPENLGRLFSAFDRLGAETSDHRGIGLGLMLAGALVEAMGGTIGVESEVGVGSTFWVRLAAAEEPLTVVERQDVPEGTDGAELRPSRTVLYVEDNLTNVALLERILARRPSVRLVAAMQGRLGVQLACEHLPDMVLLDLHLPDMTGEAVLEALRTNEDTAGIPVVVMSADATEGQVRKLLAAGAREYLTKPLDVKRFMEVLDEVIGSPTPAREG